MVTNPRAKVLTHSAVRKEMLDSDLDISARHELCPSTPAVIGVCQAEPSLRL